MEKITESQEALEVIARLDERLNLERPEVDGERPTIVIHKAYGSRYLFEIENFVKDIQKGWNGGFLDELTRYAKVMKIRKLYLGKHYYRLLNSWLERYSDVHGYSTRVTVFYDVCKELGVISQYPFSFGEHVSSARIHILARVGAAGQSTWSQRAKDGMEERSLTGRASCWDVLRGCFGCPRQGTSGWPRPAASGGVRPGTVSRHGCLNRRQPTLPTSYGGTAYAIASPISANF
jgi:hypothetical protein